MTLMFVLIIIINIYLGSCVDCPHRSKKFEKIVGIRPSAKVYYKLLYKNNNTNSITTTCAEKCFLNVYCTNFILFYNSLECYEYVNDVQDYMITESNIINDKYYITDINAAFFIKTCLNVPAGCETKLWPIEKIPGSVLITEYKKMFPGYITEEQCAQKCLSEKEFMCRSVVFKEHSYMSNISMTVGVCYFSDKDRHMMPNAFRIGSYNTNYLENQCHNHTLLENCPYEEYSDSILKHTDSFYNITTKDYCKMHCDTEQRYNCNSYSVIPITENGKTVKYKCLIHSEDSHLLGPRLIASYHQAQYFERMQCLNITVNCTDRHMFVSYHPEQIFNGRIYMSGHSEDRMCNQDKKVNGAINLKIPLVGQLCGVMEVHSEGMKNRTLLMGYLIIQYNYLIQTQGDRLIKIGCLRDNNQDLPVNVSVSAGVHFNSSEFPAHGSTIISNSSILPIVKMQIIDLTDNTEIEDVMVGQELELRITFEPADGPYDIWAGHLIAMTEKGHDSVLLLNDRGCPTDPSIFPTMTKVQTTTSKMLVAKFQAFKFTSSPTVKFSVTVHFCIMVCPKIECSNESGYIRTRRYINDINTFYNETIQRNNDTKLPLEFTIVVHGQRLQPNQVIVGENNKVLLMGYDVANNEICIEYTLLTGLLIGWLVLQIILLIGCVFILRRYKQFFEIAYERQSINDINSNFEFGINNLHRRVHWADENTY